MGLNVDRIEYGRDWLVNWLVDDMGSRMGVWYGSVSGNVWYCELE